MSDPRKQGVLETERVARVHAPRSLRSACANERLGPGSRERWQGAREPGRGCGFKNPLMGESIPGPVDRWDPGESRWARGGRDIRAREAQV